jgi:dihydrofolate reductase
MGKVVHSIFVSLDGVMERPEDWQGPFWNEDMEEYSFEVLRAADALLLGRVTYELFSKEWPNMEDDAGFADRMNSVRKFVASNTLTEATWNSTVIGGDIAAEVARLKREAGNLLIYGSSDLTQTLLRHDLVDQYLIWVHPVIAGSGKRLFQEGTGLPALKAMHLSSIRTFDTGVTVHSYRAA